MERLREAAEKAAEKAASTQDNNNYDDDDDDPSDEWQSLLLDLDSDLDPDFESECHIAAVQRRRPLQREIRKSKNILKDEMKFNEWSEDEFEAAVQTLDSDQMEIFNVVEDHCKKIADKNNYPLGPSPIHMFCSGSAG